MVGKSSGSAVPASQSTPLPKKRPRGRVGQVLLYLSAADPAVDASQPILIDARCTPCPHRHPGQAVTRLRGRPWLVRGVACHSSADSCQSRLACASTSMSRSRSPAGWLSVISGVSQRFRCVQVSFTAEVGCWTDASLSAAWWGDWSALWRSQSLSWTLQLSPPLWFLSVSCVTPPKATSARS